MENKDKYFQQVLVSTLSPDYTKKLQVGEIGDDSSGWITQVLLSSRACALEVYGVLGKSLGIKAYWRGNDTIVITTKSALKPYMKHEFVQCMFERTIVVYIQELQGVSSQETEINAVDRQAAFRRSNVINPNTRDQYVSDLVKRFPHTKEERRF